MANSKDSEKPVSRRPATTPEARENQMIALATDVAEQQLLSGNVTSQVLTHYLKLATAKERLEQEKLRRENILLQAKTEALAANKRLEELYTSAISAMKSYAGHDDLEEDEYDEYE